MAMMSMSMGVDYVFEQRQTTGLFFITHVDNQGGMISRGECSWFVHQSCLVILPAFI
jgi:hypothetical protein